MAQTHKAAAAALGAEHGHNAATWTDTDSIEREAAAILADGEPEEWAELRSGPLSGEWADGLTPSSLAREVGADPEDTDKVDSLADAYEASFEREYSAELRRRARAYA